MPAFINIAIFFLWLLSAAVDYNSFCYIWQLKEYRSDRFKDFFWSEQGKKYFQSYPFLWRSLLAIVIFLWPINDMLVVKYFIIIIFGLDFFHNFFQHIKGKLRRPVITAKSSLIILSSFVIEGGLFFITRDWIVLVLLVILRFFIISLVVYLFSFPTWWIKRRYIDKATKKMAGHKKLIVIGITGSYGKSSVKEFLSHFLSTTFTVIKTPKNVNTEIGVAKFILATDFSKADTFIVEMGAYRTGEIKLISDMVKPSIGILTVIVEQHLSLFGSMKNIQSAKYELLRSLPKDGYAVTNADNRYCTEFLGELEVEKKETFGMEESHKPTCLITNVTTTKQGIECEGTYLGKTGKLSAPVIGGHHVYNIAPAMMVAVHLGVEEQKMFEAAATLPKDIHGSIQIYSYGKAIIIDDSYNSNPEGFKAALDVLNSFSSDKKRFVVTRGMLELGERSVELHEQIGGEIAFVADELVIISKDSFHAMKNGVGDKYRTKILFKEDAKDLLKYIKELKEEMVVILLENRIPQIVMDEISTYKQKL